MNNFNDDKAARPYLHGAYEVETFKRNGVAIPPLLTDASRIKRIFIHRKSYFITQSMTDEMSDFRLTYDLPNQKLILTDYNNSKMVFDFNYSESDSILRLRSIIYADTIEIIAKQIDLSRLPLMQDDFHWRIEDYE